MGLEMDEHAALGFDLILGIAMLRRSIEDTFRVHDRLLNLNRNRLTRFAVLFSVDTHDTGNPAFWNEPLVKAVGFNSMRLRHFVSRFGSAGLARRPKYEVMGSQDLSYGLYASNVIDKNLVWIGDEAYNRGYHRLEDMYEQYRVLLAQGEIVQRYVDDDAAWWTISGGNRWLIAVIALEPASVDRGIDAHIALPQISYTWRVREPNFAADHTEEWQLSGTHLNVTLAAQRAFRLFEVQPTS
jgi:hypothetical protein